MSYYYKHFLNNNKGERYAKLVDLTNKQFKNYLVKEKAQSKNGKVYWLCECQICHKQKEIQGTHLKNGTFVNCCEQNKSILNNNLLVIKKCLICGQPFIPKVKGKTRKYCYTCSPAESDRVLLLQQSVMQLSIS